VQLGLHEIADAVDVDSGVRGDERAAVENGDRADVPVAGAVFDAEKGAV